MREAAKKIAEWLGHTTTFNEYSLEIQGTAGIFVHKECTCGKESRLGKKYNQVDTAPLCQCNYATSDADAISLLPVLVERGFYFILQDEPPKYKVNIGRYKEDYSLKGYDRMLSIEVKESTISAAITSAILSLIDKEK